MKRNRKILATLLTAVITASSLTPFAVTADEEHEPITLTIVDDHSEEAAATIITSAAFRYCMERYKEDHPWVTLEETVVAPTDIGNKYSALIAADELPDITYCSRNYLDKMVSGGMLVDLTDYVDPDKYYDGLEAETYDGKIWGMENKYTVYNLIVYNTRLWEEAGYTELPATFEELVAADEAFDKMGINTISFGNTFHWTATNYFITPLMYNYCGEEFVRKLIFGEPGAKWTDESVVKAMEAAASLGPLFNADFNMMDDVTAASMYMQGKAACHVIGGWGLPTLQGMDDENSDVWENTRVFLVPSANNSEGYLSAAGVAAMGVSSRLLEEGKEEELQAAIEFCQYISSDEYAQYCAEHGTTTPIKTEYDWSDMGQQYEDLANVINDTPHVGMVFGTYLNSTINATLETEVQNLLAGDATPEEVCANIQAVHEQIYGA